MHSSKNQQLSREDIDLLEQLILKLEQGAESDEIDQLITSYRLPNDRYKAMLKAIDPFIYQQQKYRQLKNTGLNYKIIGWLAIVLPVLIFLFVLSVSGGIFWIAGLIFPFGYRLILKARKIDKEAADLWDIKDVFSDR